LQGPTAYAVGYGLAPPPEAPVSQGLAPPLHRANTCAARHRGDSPIDEMILSPAPRAKSAHGA